MSDRILAPMPWLVLAAALLLSGCANAGGQLRQLVSPATPASKPAETVSRTPAATAKQSDPRPAEATALPPGVPAPAAEPVWGRRFYLDDGPGDRPLAELDAVPDAIPVAEPIKLATSRPYSVFGTTYTPMDQASGFKQRGLASWYGKRFHGKPTASGEPYDMYAMSAAHPTLPIPSYARVTHLGNGRSVVVRINDRGPFHPGRVMDLSYAAAHRLGFASRGSAEVKIEALQADDVAQPAAADKAPILQTVAAGAAEVAPADEARNPPPLSTRQRRNGQGAAGELWLQLGAFGSRDNAESLRQAVLARLPELAPGLTVAEAGGRWRLRVGPLYDREAMEYVRSVLREKMAISAITVRP